MKIENLEKLVANLHDEIECVIHIRNLKQVFRHGLVLQEVHRMVKFYKKACLQPDIDMNNELKKMTLRKTLSS